MTNLSVAQLRQALALREKLDELESELARLLGSASAGPNGSVAPRAPVAAVKPKRTMSAAGRARIAAAARKRWRKAKAAGKTTLGG
jgi:hypothetical protein